MKILKIFFISAPLALTMACGTDIDQQDQDDRQVLEQHEEQSDQHTDRSMRSREGELDLASAQSSSAVSIDHLIGSVVRTRDGNQEVGTLEDILTDSNGEPIVAVISIGEFLGIGEKGVAVDWEIITVVSDNAILVNMTEQTLKDAPEFDRTLD